jgi:transitional endoplasmic reticulum ATPase
MFHDVLVNLRAAAEFAPANIPLRLTLAQTLFSENLVEDAENEYRNIIEVAPYSTEAKCGLAKVCIAKGDQEMAKRILSDVCKEPDVKPEFHLLYSKLLLRTQQPEEAKIQYQLATTKDERLKEPGLEKLFA